MRPFSPAPLRALPVTLTAWQAERLRLRAQLWSSLGDLPPLFTPESHTLEKTVLHGCPAEKFVFDNGAGAQVYGWFIFPPNQTAPAPGILYLHVHGNKYQQGKDELFRERIPGIMPGPDLARAGYVVLCIDAYGFGEREYHGPLGAEESGSAVESALYKHFIWQGMTLWGMMLRDDLLALNLLLIRPEVDTQRVALTGMSLGGSRATWLAALDDRAQAVIPVAQMTRYRDFAASGRYNLHGIYYYVPGFLKSGIDMEHLVALAAPRMQTILIGDSDPLSPVSGIRTVIEQARSIYRLYDAEQHLTAHIEPDIAHAYTPTMYAAMRETLKRL